MSQHTAYRPSRTRQPARTFAFALLLALHAASLASPHAARAENDGAAPKPDAPRKPDPPPKSPGAREGEAPTGNPECVHVRNEARYIPYGYDHIVEVDNGCEKAVSCTITTDVNPATTHLDVPAGQLRSVTTFRGSPAREFKADVSCKEQD